LENYRKVLQASVSPPLVFPPAEIEGSLFADGGTTELLLAVGLQDAEGSSSVPSSGDGTFFVIFNDKERAEVRAITPRHQGGIDSVAATVERQYGVDAAARLRPRLGASVPVQAHEDS
jgi:hypothetical protein